MTAEGHGHKFRLPFHGPNSLSQTQGAGAPDVGPRGIRGTYPGHADEEFVLISEEPQPFGNPFPLVLHLRKMPIRF